MVSLFSYDYDTKVEQFPVSTVVILVTLIIVCVVGSETALDVYGTQSAIIS